MQDLDALAADLRDRLLADAGDAEAPGVDVAERIRALVDREAAVLDAGARAELVGRIAERAFGLGPLEPLLGDPAVDEIMVSGTAPVWVERAGRLQSTGVRFAREADLRDAIERILAPLGRRVDAMRALGVSRQTVLQRVKRGELDALHVRQGRRKGLRIRIPTDQGLFDPTTMNAEAV
jgi:pilus assembly protein CpaF